MDQQLYQAELDDVPMAFADGSVVSGERRGQHALAIWTQSPGRHAEIRAAHIATVLVVRQSGRSLSLSVYSPRSVVEAFGPEQDLQLCVWGCPASQKLSAPPPTSSTFSADVLAHCSALLPVRDVYHQACVFDLITSGDLNSSGAAISALQDAQKLISDPKRVHLLSTTSAAQRETHLCLLLLLLGLLLNIVLMETGSLTQEVLAWTHQPKGGCCIFISSSSKKILFSNGSVLRLTGRGGAYGVFFSQPRGNEEH